MPCSISVGWVYVAHHPRTRIHRQVLRARRSGAPRAQHPQTQSRCCARGAPRAQHRPRDEELLMRRKSVSTQHPILSTYSSAPLRRCVKYCISIKPNRLGRFHVITGSKTVGSMSVQGRLRDDSGSVICRFGVGFLSTDLSSDYSQLSFQKVFMSNRPTVSRDQTQFLRAFHHRRTGPPPFPWPRLPINEGKHD